MKAIFTLAVSLFFYLNLNAQVTLSADGTTDTYDLINSVLAPGYDVVESPDNSCGENADFGYHIKQEFNNELNEDVFSFYIFVDENSDRCRNYDRQRNEIKTYDQSPDNLLGVEGETVVYKWKFKLPEGMQYTSSFTHIHQIKPVGGYDSMPLYTLTVAGSSSGELRLRYSQVSESQTTLHAEGIEDFLGVWVEVTEEILYGTSGTYSISIDRVSDGANLFSYENSNISNWRLGDAGNSFEENEFMRPKWGIYRSLGSADPNSPDSKRDQLRDEKLLYNDFSIEEVDTALSTDNFDVLGSVSVYPNPTSGNLYITNPDDLTINKISLFTIYGKKIYESNDYRYLDTSNFSSGSYILKMQGEQASKSELILIGN